MWTSVDAPTAAAIEAGVEGLAPYPATLPTEVRGGLRTARDAVCRSRSVVRSTPTGYTPSEMPETVTYHVPKIHCAHCGASIKEEVSEVAGVASVEVDVDTKVVTIRGESLDDTALRVAIEEAGYEAA
jgi:copper chaperone CopZ